MAASARFYCTLLIIMLIVSAKWCNCFLVGMIEKAATSDTVSRPGKHNRKSVVVVDDSADTQQPSSGGCCS